ncbi:MAG: glycoside hydrolase family 13 protein [Clostridiales bacterium]|nr:glycoside hydrolase family 13 protein [Clostridiales bacterium]
MLAFDSWDEQYKRPFGAITQDCPIHFWIRPSKAFLVSSARLRMIPDGKSPLVVDMQRLDVDEENDLFYCAYALSKPGLYWYDFELDTPNGRQYVSLVEGGRGDITEHATKSWQLTVYHSAFQTPDWLKGGLIYQIMPDRFAREGRTLQEIPEGRFLREDWGGIPEHRGDKEGNNLSNTYFGGNLRGITSKLSYLKSLGITAIYLNPIFEAHTNHRYNTADYLKIDPLLGTEKDFKDLCSKAGGLGIRVILDGVFSHTGDDSRYFNRQGRYRDEDGAYQSKASPYYSWYDFKKWPDDYRCWWGYETLPEVNETNESYLAFITGPDGVLEHWIKAGASGFRLDVADELPSEFIRKLRETVKNLNKEAIIIGEVWEDASCKISYGERKSYLNGVELDSVMNYPFRNAIVAFLKGSGAQALYTVVMTILEHYPRPCIDVLMNLLGTHDTLRILTELKGDKGDGHDRAWKAEHHLTRSQREEAICLLRLAAVLQFCLPGVPSIYYGDEAGLEGYEDPFNRGCYCWGKEDTALIDFYQKLGSIRNTCPALRSGDFRALAVHGDLIVFERYTQDQQLVCAVNAGKNNEFFDLPDGFIKIAGDCIRENSLTGIYPKNFAIFTIISNQI